MTYIDIFSISRSFFIIVVLQVTGGIGFLADT